MDFSKPELGSLRQPAADGTPYRIAAKLVPGPEKNLKVIDPYSNKN